MADPEPSIRVPHDAAAELVRIGLNAFDEGRMLVAARSFEKAGEMGNTTGMWNASLLFRELQSWELSFSWTLRAAESGLIAAMNECAVMFQSGLGVCASEENALHWFRICALNDDGDGMTNLAMMHALGLGCEKNFSEAVFWLRRAVGMGKLQACNFLAFLLELGQGGVKRDPEKAFSLYLQGALSGDALCMLSLSRFYSSGLCSQSPVNMYIARQWIDRCKDTGDADDLFDFGEMCLEGHSGIAMLPSYANALEFFTASVEKGGSSSCQSAKERIQRVEVLVLIDRHFVFPMRSKRARTFSDVVVICCVEDIQSEES